MLTKLLRDKELGKLVVPIIPDEARTFGMESLFRQFGIYSHVGQLYEPVDNDTLLYYHEAKDGQILEEGITEAGSMSSFIAAGTAYATHGIPMIPFFIYYSMFGFQRIGDLIWAAADCALPRLPAGRHGRPHDARRRGPAAPGRPQPRAGADRCPTCLCLRPGLRLRDRGDHPGRHPPDVRATAKSVFYYLTAVQRELRDAGDAARARREGILKGPVQAPRRPAKPKAKLRAHLLGSGSILREVLRAQEMLAEQYGVAADVWSVTSYKELRRDGLAAERWNLLHPGEHAEACRTSTTLLASSRACSSRRRDYMKVGAGHDPPLGRRRA